MTQVRPKAAATSKEFNALVKAAVEHGELEVAALMAVARQFLLRVPSEGIPLEWEGLHSCVVFESHRAVVTLSRRKNTRVPVTLTRDCCCTSTGQRLCAVHWLHALRRASEGKGRVFTLTKHYFATRIKELAAQVGVPDSARFGTHLFRRGMAQDLLDQGGSVAALMVAGGWTSTAFTAYLRRAQIDDVAVARSIIHLSDSE